jgi:apolipoprotein N-acyltransferase
VAGERAAFPWRVLAVAATGGVLFGLGAPPHGITGLIWLGFAPLVWAAMQLADRSWRTRFVVGWVGGLGVGLVGFPWIAELLVTFADAPLPLAGLGLFVFAAWTAVPYGIWCASLDPRARTGVRAWLWPVVSWIGLATVWPAVFPYTPVIGLAEQPQWLQAAELFGVPACDAQVVLCGVALAHAAVAADLRARALRIALALAIPVVSYGLGELRMDAVLREAESAPRVRFGIVQPNVPLMAFDPTDRALRLWAMSYEAEREGAQVVVWPEAGAFPFHTFRPMTHDFDDPGCRPTACRRSSAPPASRAAIAGSTTPCTRCRPTVASPARSTRRSWCRSASTSRSSIPTGRSSRSRRCRTTTPAMRRPAS